MNKHPYTYTVLRYVHDTGTGEFVNVGVVLNAPAARYARAILRPTYGRVSRIFPDFDSDHFRRVIRHLQAHFDEMSDRIAQELDFGQIPVDALALACNVIAQDDSAFQWSPMGGGLSANLPETAETIYKNMVERYDEKPKGESRSDDIVWKTFKSPLEKKKVLSRFHPKIIAVADDEVEFTHAWQNRQWHCIEPVSFDLLQPQSIKDKAHSWLGRVTSVQKSAEPFQIYYLVGEPQIEKSRRAFDQALNILHKTPVKHEIVREHEADGFASAMEEKIITHENEAENQT